MSYYKVAINELEFQVFVGILNKKLHYILSDSEGQQCVSIVATNESPSKYYLSKVAYRPTCALGRTLEKGASTILMIKALLLFIVGNDNRVEEIYFYDTSKFDCVLAGDDFTIEIPLHTHNFILYGKTWYQRQFNAEFADNALSNELELADRMLETKVSLNPGPASILLYSIDNDEPLSSNGEYSNVLKECHSIIENANNITYRQLFYEIFSTKGHIAEKFGASISCSLYYSFENKLISEFNLIDLDGAEMVLKRRTIEDYSEHITVSENTSPKHALSNTIFRYTGGSIREAPHYREGGKGTRKKKMVKQKKPGWIRMVTYHDDLLFNPKYMRRTRRANPKRVRLNPPKISFGLSG
jgi:hypothetical protein